MRFSNGSSDVIKAPTSATEVEEKSFSGSFQRQKLSILNCGRLNQILKSTSAILPVIIPPGWSLIRLQSCGLLAVLLHVLFLHCCLRRTHRLLPSLLSPCAFQIQLGPSFHFATSAQQLKSFLEAAVIYNTALTSSVGSLQVSVFLTNLLKP